jgi:hypothetical protein
MALTRASALAVASTFALATVGASTHAQLGPGSPPPVPVEQRGLKIGERIPPLDVVDQFGRHQTLASLTGPKGLVLLFVRSADW